MLVAERAPCGTQRGIGWWLVYCQQSEEAVVLQRRTPGATRRCLEGVSLTNTVFDRVTSCVLPLFYTNVQRLEGGGGFNTGWWTCVLPYNWRGIVECTFGHYSWSYHAVDPGAVASLRH